jgi:hypothetical protein
MIFLFFHKTGDKNCCKKRMRNTFRFSRAKMMPRQLILIISPSNQKAKNILGSENHVRDKEILAKLSQFTNIKYYKNINLLK